MPKYEVYVSWQMGKTLIVDANTPDDAAEKAHQINERSKEPLDKGEYISSSFAVDYIEEVIEE